MKDDDVSKKKNIKIKLKPILFFHFSFFYISCVSNASPDLDVIFYYFGILKNILYFLKRPAADLIIYRRETPGRQMDIFQNNFLIRFF